VEARIITTKYDRNNRDLIRNWIRNGFEVRFLNEFGGGFELYTYDDFCSVTSVNNSEDRSKSVGIAVYNKEYVKTQIGYFEGLWEKSNEV
jgi:hypothetical protein